MRYSLNEETAPRFAQYGVNVWGLDANADVMENAKLAIEKTAEFFKSIGLPSTLRETGITSDEHFEEMADHIKAHWFADLKYAIKPLDRNDIIQILKNSL